MALKIPPRVLETSTTTGTGTLTLAGAVTGWQSFAAVGDGHTCQYVLWAVDADGVPTGDWEEGLGTYTSSGTTLARTTVYNSSNAGAAVNLAAGTKYVAVGRTSMGTMVVRQPGGTAGTDEGQVYHDGTNFYIVNADDANAVVFGPATRVFGGGGGAAGTGRVYSQRLYAEGSTGTFKALISAAELSFILSSDVPFTWHSTDNIGGTTSGGVAGFALVTTSVIKVTDGTTGGGALDFQEMTAPSAPAANNVVLYAEDNGSGKTRLMARFATGAAQQVAIEP